MTRDFRIGPVRVTLTLLLLAASGSSARAESAARYPGPVTTTPSINAVGILSPGEMGSGVGEVLHQHGLRVLTCLAGRGAGSRERAARAGFEDTPDLEALVGACDVLLSIVPPAVAGAVADQVAAAVRATGANLLYADCNAIAPGTARAQSPMPVAMAG